VDAPLAQFFAAVGDGRIRIVQVRIVGGDGADIGHAAFDLQPPAIRDPSLVKAALRSAEAAAAGPQHCARPATAASGP